jgi:hypothetical protein
MASLEMVKEIIYVILFALGEIACRCFVNIDICNIINKVQFAVRVSETLYAWIVCARIAMISHKAVRKLHPILSEFLIVDKGDDDF